MAARSDSGLDCSCRTAADRKDSKINILMFTNTYAPHVGGVARSVETLCAELTKRQHKVMVIAPSFEGHVTDIPGVVVRVPSVKHVGNSDYSVPIPLSRRIRDEIDAFRPDVVHSHHPFLLGHTALRIAASVGVPLVFTYHTRYDIYVRQFIESDRLFPDLARNLANGYANLADKSLAVAPGATGGLGSNITAHKGNGIFLSAVLGGNVACDVRFDDGAVVIVAGGGDSPRSPSCMVVPCSGVWLSRVRRCESVVRGGPGTESNHHAEAWGRPGLV